MKYTKNYRRLFLIATGLFIGLTGLAQGQQMDERKVSKTYLANSGSYVELSNKYGDIEIEHWDKDSVQIDVRIRTYSDKYDWRKNMMESIEVDFTHSSGFIVVETNWGDEAGIWRKKVYNVSKEIASNRIEVKYTVHLPKSMPLEIDNRFGNVFIGDHDAELEVKVHHGDFRARRLKNLRKLDVRYGKVKVKEIEKGQIELGSGSSLDLDEAGELMITSSSSEIEIEEVESLNITSRHDDIFIENPSRVNGSLSLSDLKISRLEEELTVDCKFGSVRIQEVAERALKVEIEGNKTDIVIGLSQSFAGRFDIDVDGDEDLSYPEDMYVVSSGKDDDKRLRMKGAMGKEEGTRVSISSSNGFVKIGD